MPGQDLGQHPVHTSPLRVRRGLVDGRTDQRMAHPHGQGVGDEQPGGRGGLERVLVHPEGSRCLPDRGQIAGVLGSRDEHQQLHLVRKPSTAVEEDVFDPVSERQMSRERGRAPELSLAELGRKLQERQRVAARLRDQPVGDLLGGRGTQALVQQGPGRLRIQPRQHELGQALGPERPLGAVAGREDHQHAVGGDPSSAEEQSIGGGRIEPVRVLDDAHHQALLGGRCQQRQGRDGHQERLHGWSVLLGERHAQRPRLWVGQMLAQPHQRA